MANKKVLLIILSYCFFATSIAQEITLITNDGDSILTDINATSSNSIFTKAGTFKYSQIDTILFHNLNTSQNYKSLSILKKLDIKTKPVKTWVTVDNVVKSYLLTDDSITRTKLESELRKWQGSVTDSQIASTLLNLKLSQVRPALDSLGVWYYHHHRYYSIADGNGTVKLFKFDTEDLIIIKLIVNYRHDNIEHLEDLRQIKNYSEKRIGTYSTDVYFSNN